MKGLKSELIDYMGSDESVVMAARVSFANDKSTRTEKDNAKLIGYLARHNHWTPFAHTSVTLRMTAPVPIRTQCFKHKVGFVENEESRRYISSTPEYFIPDFRTSVEHKKQGSGGLHKYNKELQASYVQHVLQCIKKYEQFLAQGVAEEQARFLLPQGVVVNWYWTGSVAAFARFCRQRMDSHAQKEIQDLATQVSEIIEPLYPVSWNALIGE